MKKLISMTDFVISQWSMDLTKKQRERITNYANFLKQPLELWMFVPCDENGNPLVFDYPQNKAFEDIAQVEFEKQYQQAKERCLFNMWNVIDKIDITICIENKSKHRLFLPNCMTIEDIVYTNSQFTQTAIKQIGL